MTVSYARHQFPPPVIQHADWLYLRFTLSFRDVEDLLAERGLDISYETVRRWVASCGADAAPYFRVFNPSLQGTKFDPSGDYVRRWVPEIAKLPNSLLHSPWEARPIELADAGIHLGRTYPAPIVEHGGARQRALEAFKRIKKG